MKRIIVLILLTACAEPDTRTVTQVRMNVGPGWKQWRCEPPIEFKKGDEMPIKELFERCKHEND